MVRRRVRESAAIIELQHEATVREYADQCIELHNRDGVLAVRARQELGVPVDLVEVNGMHPFDRCKELARTSRTAMGTVGHDGRRMS